MIPLLAEAQLYWLGQSLVNPFFLGGFTATTAIVELQPPVLFHCLQIVVPTPLP